MIKELKYFRCEVDASFRGPDRFMGVSLLFVVNDAAFFLSHRLGIALGAREAGYLVKVATMPGPAVERIRNLGFEHFFIPMDRSGRNPAKELVSFFSILKLLWMVRPDVLHLVTIKPVIYGGFAARLAPVKGVVCAVSGLGFVFTTDGFKANILRNFIKRLYRLALGKKNLKVIFQNPDDRNVLLGIKAITSAQVEMIRGSGVDLSLYQIKPEPTGVPVVCFTARLLRDKGIFEFIDAARFLKQKGVMAHFVVAGDIDPGNPTSVSSWDLERWRTEGFVKILGYQRDVASFFSKVNLVVLPSYREGLPKVLVEAAAAGRAVITTDVPGCRDAVEPGVTGLLVPVKDAELLAHAIEKLINDTASRYAMGKAGRELAEREFGIEKIVQQHLNIYKKLEGNA